MIGTEVLVFEVLGSKSVKDTLGIVAGKTYITYERLVFVGCEWCQGLASLTYYAAAKLRKGC